MRNYLTNRRDNTFDLFDDVFDTFFQPVLYTGRNSHIRADIKENEKEKETLLWVCQQHKRGIYH